MTLTIILIIIRLLINYLLKKTIKYYMTDFKKRMRIQTVIKSTFITITSILILFTWIQATNAIILVAIIIGVLIIVMARGLTNNIIDRKSTRLNSSHVAISYAVFCLKKKI